MTKNRFLEIKATQLLRKNGFTAAGRPKQSISVRQCWFERKLVLTPMGGAVKK